jgi:hypothetical protein
MNITEFLTKDNQGKSVLLFSLPHVYETKPEISAIVYNEKVYIISRVTDHFETVENMFFAKQIRKIYVKQQ